MADPKHIELLLSGAENWNKAREEENDFVPDLSFADLRGQKFKDYNFVEALLLGSKLDFASFENCNFTHAYFGTSSTRDLKLSTVFVDDTYGLSAEYPNDWAGRLSEHFRLLASGRAIQDSGSNNGIDIERINLVAQGRPHVVDSIIDREIQCAIGIYKGYQHRMDSKSIRSSICSQGGFPLVSIHGFEAFLDRLESESFSLDALFEHYRRPASAVRTSFSGCTFTEATFDQMDISVARFEQPVELTQEQIDSAIGDDSVMLPAGLNRPTIWSRRGIERKEVSLKSVKTEMTQIQLLSATLAERIEIELDGLNESRPNHPASISMRNDHKKFLLESKQILDQIIEVENDAEEVKNLLELLKSKISDWIENNIEEVIDSGIRIPALAGSVALLSAAGASMGPATIAAIALIGGPRVLKWYKKLKGKGPVDE